MARIASILAAMVPQLVWSSARVQQPLPRAPVHATKLPDGTPWLSVYRVASGYLVRISELGDFEVAMSGALVVARAAPGVSRGILEQLYVNQVKPFALSFLNKLVLHGSSVEIDGEAAAFIGESRRGKSTLAASFASCGFPFLADDGLILDQADGGFMVTPDHPALRLWADSRQMLPDEVEASATEYNAKLRVLAGGSLPFCTEPRPLKVIYFPGTGGSPGVSIEAVGGQDAIISLVRQCFLLGLDEKPIIRRNFGLIAALSRSIKCFHLDYPRRYDVLDQVRNAIIDHFRTVN